ncbi:MAG TPA: hypothetical protein VGE34_04165 [Candidatus Saccharimonadales bacterium]
MIDHLLRIIAPSPCYGCGQIGLSLCDNCEFDIVNEPYVGCVSCQRPAGTKGICNTCVVLYDQAWVVSERTDVIENLLDGYKFEREKASFRIFAKLLHSRLPIFGDIHIEFVPIPTISSHIRQRGYDHMKLITRELARLRNASYSPVLVRKTNTKQLGSSKVQRIQNAKHAFEVRKPLDDTIMYVLVDDVFTTGSTITYAAKALRDAGAGSVSAAIIARQPLDKVG